MKTLWTDSYLSDLSTEAEIQISSQVPCIYTRFPLSVTLGTSVYDFQDTNVTPVAQRLTGIIRVTWQGFTVHPMFQKTLRDLVTTLKPGNGDVQTSRPYIYMRQGFGMDRIKFFPAPNLSIAYNNSDIDTQTGIASNVIVSGWRIADPTGDTYRIPDYVLATIVRYYVLARAYKKEGKGQNLDAAKYYDNMYQWGMGRFKQIVEQLFTSRTKSVSAPITDMWGTKPPHPVLPPNFGPIVE